MSDQKTGKVSNPTTKSFFEMITNLLRSLFALKQMTGSNSVAADWMLQNLVNKSVVTVGVGEYYCVGVESVIINMQHSHLVRCYHLANANRKFLCGASYSILN